MRQITPSVYIYPLPETICLAEMMPQTTALASNCPIPATTRYSTTFSTTLTTFIFPRTTGILTLGTPPDNQALTSSEAPCSAVTSGDILMAQDLARPAKM